MENFHVNYHASVCLGGDIYIDPLNIKGEPHNARAVFITHSHWDHLDIEDIKKVSNEKTHFIGPEDCMQKLESEGIKGQKTTVIAGQRFRLFMDTKVLAFYSYNLSKPYHKKNGFVGYLIEINGVKYAICGDTDLTPELREIKCDVLFVPIGGTYTMDAKEAAECANHIKPKLVVPIHYLALMPDDSILGTKEDERIFLDNLDSNIKYKIVL